MQQIKLFDKVEHKREHWVGIIDVDNPSNSKVRVDTPNGKRWVYRTEIKPYDGTQGNEVMEHKTDIRFFG